MKNGFIKDMFLMVLFTAMFMLSLSQGNIFFMSIAMFTAARAFRNTSSSMGFVCFILGLGFLFAAVFSPVFNAMAGLNTTSYINSSITQF